MASFRRICRTFHRELGFFVVGLTLVYAISGIAVNHVKDWDPNHSRRVDTWRIDAPGPGPTAEVEPMVLDRLDLDVPVKSTWRAAPDRFQVFVENGEIDVDLVTGEVVRSRFSRRPLLHDLNFMHLNTGKGIWTVIADAFAVVLVILPLTGVFLVRGRRGLSGRGGLLMLLGILLPLFYAVYMRF